MEELIKSEVEIIGGDKPILQIYWGDEWIDTNSTIVDDTNDSHWDYVLDINGGNPVSMGIYEVPLQNLTFDKTYYYRAYSENIGGGQWAGDVQSFTASDTRFTKYTMDGLVLWLDAMDVDGDGFKDMLNDGARLPLWIDKSLNEKNALQSVPVAMPTYTKSAFMNNPGVRFSSGESYNVGTLNLNTGGIHAFVVGQGQGVGVGASSGSIGWTLDIKTNPRLGSYFNENNVLQQITIGKDPSTGFGQFTGELCEIMLFDRILSQSEKLKIEGYLAHKWGILDDLAGSSYKVKSGLSIYYPFTETDGSVVQDNSPNLRNANLIDGDLNAVGYFGSGVEFDNMEQAKISLDENQLDLPNNWTISSWFTSPFNVDTVLFVHALTSGSNDAHVAFDSWGDQRLGSFDSPTFESVDFGATNLTAGWHHLVARAAGGQTSFWIDGNPVGSVNLNVASPVEVIGNLPGGFGRFADKLDDFRIYSRALGGSEISDLYGDGNGDFGAHYYSTFSPVFDNVPEILLPSAPLVHWTLDELNGTTVIDSSGKGNDGNASSFSNLYLFLKSDVTGQPLDSRVMNQ